MNKVNFEIGQDQSGNIVNCNFDDLKNIKVIGCTGSGKTNLFNLMICNLAKNKNRQDYELYLVDMKQVELTVFAKFADGYVKKSDKLSKLLDYLEDQKTKRTKLLKQRNLGNIDEYNNQKQVQNGKFKKLKYIYVFVDEYGDLCFIPQCIERINKLLKNCNNVGIKFIVSTQCTYFKNKLKNQYFETKIALKVLSARDGLGLLNTEDIKKFSKTGELFIKSPALGDNILHLFSKYASYEKIKFVLDNI